MSDIFRVTMVPDRQLPEALTNSDEFAQLSDIQREAFKARLRYIEEITIKIKEWNASPSLDDYSTLDEIELDLLMNVGVSHVKREKMVSSWVIHSSWTFNTSPNQRAKLVPEELLEEIQAPLPGILAPSSSIRSWLGKQAQALRAALTQFYEADSFKQAVALYLTIDTILAQMLSVCYRCRLNPKISKPQI